MHERERPPCDVWDLKVIPRGTWDTGGYGGRGACKANASTDAFLLFSLLKPLELQE